MADTYTHSQRIAYQPLHPSVRPKLEKLYRDFHDGHFQYLKPDTEWNPDLRTAPSRFASTSSGPVKVGHVRDINVGNFQLRIYTPEGVPPTAGWPVLLGYHGGKVLPFVASEYIQLTQTQGGGFKAISAQMNTYGRRYAVVCR
jgi:acetyl esterase/lipase